MKNDIISNQNIDKICDTRYDRNDEKWKKHFIELKLEYGKTNHRLGLQELLVIQKIINKIDESKNYNEAYENFVLILKEACSEKFMDIANLKEKKSTPLKAKIVYQKNLFDTDEEVDFLIGKNAMYELCQVGLLQIASAIGMAIDMKSPISLSILIIFILRTSEFLIKIAQLLIASELEEELEFKIKRLLYGYKNGEISQVEFKEYLILLISTVNEQYERGNKNEQKNR